MNKVFELSNKCRNQLKAHLSNFCNIVLVLFFIIICSGLFFACQNQKALLPRTLYFLKGWGEESQIWMLDVDGITKIQLTFEPRGIDDFSVSQKDGRLAYVSGNRLYLADQEGKNGELIADASIIDNQIEGYYFHGVVDTPVFSPDGKYLAYGFDGLHIYNPSTGVDEHLLKNLGNSLGESYIFAQEAYYPESWSSDGERLLFVMGYYEGDTLGIMEMGKEKIFRRLYSGQAVCCHYNWSPDNAHVLASNPYFVVNLRPGLWRYDALTGEKTNLISGSGTGDIFYFVGWPYQLPSGDLYFFYLAENQFSHEEVIPLKLCRSQMDGSDIQEVRPEEFHIREVLWGINKSEALILGRTEGDINHLILFTGVDEPLQILIDQADTIHSLTWGP